MTGMDFCGDKDRGNRLSDVDIVLIRKQFLIAADIYKSVNVLVVQS